MTSIRLRPVVLTLSASMLSAALLGCLQTVEGERAMTGMCPAGETCSTGEVRGIQFVGQAFFDAELATQLGPVAAGGTFQLGLVGVGGPLGDYDVTWEDDSGFTAAPGRSQFLPLDESGNSLAEVDGHIVLRGRSASSSYLRITDPTDGTLIDRLRMDVVEIDEVAFGLARDPERDYLIAGCPELVAVRLLSHAGGGERRIFDQSVVITTDGEVLDEQMWDCISYEAAEGTSEASFQIFVANESHERTMPVLTLEEAGLRVCPARRD